VKKRLLQYKGTPFSYVEGRSFVFTSAFREAHPLLWRGLGKR
jgi:hypothetical protein